MGKTFHRNFTWLGNANKPYSSCPSNFIIMSGFLKLIFVANYKDHFFLEIAFKRLIITP